MEVTDSVKAVLVAAAAVRFGRMANDDSIYFQFYFPDHPLAKILEADCRVVVCLRCSHYGR